MERWLLWWYSQCNNFCGNVSSSTGTSTFNNVTVNGTLSATLTGSISGNSATATALQTARSIGGVSFNGTADINLPGVNQLVTKIHLVMLQVQLSHM